ncbi:hypothetical protein ACMA1D_14070 [Streptomyces sp. 796.1]|uniref:hypothetical protein n=1 Tax=Streptomyces sp. 796.1 TaxID=3163029 RepID=UPI0039C9B524
MTPAGADWLASASAFPRSVHALWAARPGAPSVLPCGTAFDVVSAPALFGRRMVDRLWCDGPGSGPVAVQRGRVLMFTRPGVAQRLPSLLSWEEWGAGVPPLLYHGTGDAVTIPPLHAAEPAGPAGPAGPGDLLEPADPLLGPIRAQRPDTPQPSPATQLPPGAPALPGLPDVPGLPHGAAGPAQPGHPAAGASRLAGEPLVHERPAAPYGGRPEPGPAGIDPAHTARTGPAAHPQALDARPVDGADADGLAQALAGPASRWLVAPEVRHPWLPGPDVLLWACVRAARRQARGATAGTPVTRASTARSD